MWPRLSAGRQVEDLQLEERCIPHVYNNIFETSSKSKLCRPSARNAKAIDALLQPCTGFQITRNPHHPLNGSGIRVWMDCLQDKDAARIIFCVPAGLYSKYKKQNALHLAESFKCKQYVVKIDVDVYESV